MQELSPTQARRLAIVSQGLHSGKAFGAGKQAVLDCIEQLGYVQIDTISVVQRSHHHTFWTRVPSYKEQHLDALQREGKVLEYWAHAAAYLPMRDYRFCLPYMHAVASGQIHWRKPDKKAMKAVLDRIRGEGPLKAKDFENPGKRSKAWGWNWKPAKIALEQLFIEGKLMARHREGFQKVYDLPERVLPADTDTRMPTEAEFHRFLIRSTIRAHGLVTEAEITYLRKRIKAGVKARLLEMVEEGEVEALQVGGLKQPYYSVPESLAALAGKRVNNHVHLLSPFDNAVIQRKRLQQLFGSTYQLECFVPSAKREFGYYCLPIVYGSEIVGRLDPKADRRSGDFIIRALHLEAPIRDEEAFSKKLADKLLKVASFNECQRVRFRPRKGDTVGQLVAQGLAPR